MLNEDFFRLYALWTFAISSLHTVIYHGVFLGQYRTAFFIFLGIITVTVLLYWFRDGGTKYGWQSLDDSLFVVLFLAVIACIMMIIASIIAVQAVNKFHVQDFSNTGSILLYCYQVSPIAVVAVNLFNLLTFLARN
jgi:hypothetical protein